jgi:flagellar protein FliO/FliZ
MEIIDPHQLMKFAAALVFVLALMGLLAAALRRFNNLPSLSAPKQKRLKIIESLPLDARRRLVILQRDSRQHLVILGATGETVIESGIESQQDGSHELQNVENIFPSRRMGEGS